MRTMGIASGLDVNEIIEKLMQLERRPITQNNLLIKQTQDKMEYWRSLATRLKALEQSAADIFLPGTFKALQAVSSATDIVQADITGAAQKGTYNIDVEQLATRHTVAMGPAAGQGAVSDAGASLGLFGSFRIGVSGQEMIITVQQGDSLYDLSEKINAVQDETGVKSYVVMKESGDYRMVLESLKEGEEGRILTSRYVPAAGEEAQYGTDNILLALNFKDAADQYAYQLKDARNAKLSLNGLEIERSSNTVDDLIAGVSLLLNDTGAVTIAVEQNDEPALEAIRNFVSEYNKVNKMIWDLMEKDKGPLQGNTVLMQVQSRLMQLAGNAVTSIGGEFHTLRDVGISSPDRYGYLEIDEAKLKAALQEDPDGVAGLLGAASGGPGSTGLVKQIGEYSKLLVRTDGIIAGQQKQLQSYVTSLEDYNERLEYRMELRESSLVARFSYLETYVSMMQSQGLFLHNFIGQINTGGQ